MIIFKLQTLILYPLHMLVLHPSLPLLLHLSIYLMFYLFLISLKIIFLSLNYVKLIKFVLNFFLRIFEVNDLRTREILMCGLNEDNVYKLTLPQHQPHTCLSQALTTLPLWHQCLGYPTTLTLLRALKTNNISFTGSLNKCIDCLSNKSHKLPFSKSSITISYPLEIVYSDVWGPHTCFSKYVGLYPMKLKSNVALLFPIFQKLVENQFNIKIKTLYSDNGGEFIKLRTYL